MKFKKEILKDLCLPECALIDNIVGQTRWSTIREIIFEYEGACYRTTYSIGSTELQWETPWEGEDEIECEEVHQVEKIVKVWEAVS